MEIFIITPDSITKQILRINPKIKISEFKQKIQEATKIPTQSQIIHHNDKNITNIRSITLHRLLDKIQLSAGTGTGTGTGIGTSSVRHIIVIGEFFVKDSNLIKISIKTPKDQLIRLSVNNQEMKIIELQEKLKSSTGIPLQVQAIYYKDVNISLSQQTLLQLGISRNNSQLILWDKEDTFQIFIQLLPFHYEEMNKEISMIVSPYETLTQVQNRLEKITNIPIDCQLLTRNGINLTPQSSLTIRQLKIVSNERFVFDVIYGIIEITIIMPNQKMDILKIRRNSKILDLQKKLEELTGIPVACQTIFQGNINLSLSEKTFWQLKTLPRTKFILQNKFPLIYINIHLDNGDIRKYQLSQLQTIQMLVQDYLRQSPRCKDNVTFVCRPSANGSSPKYENAINETMTFADLHIKNGDSLCVSTISRPE